MSANCPECKWIGSYQQVVDGGYCPECWPSRVQVRYDHIELRDTGIKTIESFNRRAVTALMAVAMSDWEEGFVRSIRLAVEHYEALEEAEQKNLLRAVLRHAGQLHDRQVVDYSEIHATRITA